MAPPPPAAAAVTEAGGPPPQPQRAGFGQSIGGVIRMMVFWYFASKFFFSPKKSTDPTILMSNLFQKSEPLDMWVYLSENDKFSDFGNEKALVWQETNIPYAVWKPESTRTLSLKYQPSEALKNNGSLYAHVFFARSGFSPDPNDPEYQPLSAFGRSHPVVTFSPKSKANKKRSLLGDAKSISEEKMEGLRIADGLSLKQTYSPTTKLQSHPNQHPPPNSTPPASSSNHRRSVTKLTIGKPLTARELQNVTPTMRTTLPYADHPNRPPLFLLGNLHPPTSAITILLLISGTLIYSQVLLWSLDAIFPTSLSFSRSRAAQWAW
ncbi:hypothetical protein KSS87_020427 [Heliosperma pusillum]|nr:hypothetical protein KSS87_020427 [Heliosperma pusillum]